MKKISIKKDRIVKASVLSELNKRVYIEPKKALQVKKELTNKYGVKFNCERVFLDSKDKSYKNMIKTIYPVVYVIC